MRLGGDKVPLKYNPYTRKYEFAEEDMKITYNEWERKYEYGYDDIRELNPYNMKHSSKGRVLKYNPYTRQYENVPEHWVIRYNVYEGKYEYGPPED
jgi:hypothetical protein